MTDNTNSRAALLRFVVVEFSVLWFLSCLLGGSNGDAAEAVGFGYSVQSVGPDPSGKFLTVDLHLINASTVYGPDIQNLTLTAR